MANYTITHPAHTATLERPDHHGVLTAGCRHHNRLGSRSGSETSGIARDVRCCHKLAQTEPTRPPHASEVAAGRREPAAHPLEWAGARNPPTCPEAGYCDPTHPPTAAFSLSPDCSDSISLKPSTDASLVTYR